MNTNDTTNTSKTTITAADIEAADIEELLRTIFAPDVDLKGVLETGIAQVKMTEKLIAEQAKAEQKVAKKEARLVRSEENRDRNINLFIGTLHGVTAGASVAMAVLGASNPIGWGMLATTASTRLGHDALKVRRAVKIRDAARAGEPVDPESLLRARMSDMRFEAILGLADAGVMTQLGLIGKDPVWVVLAVMNLLNAGLAGASAHQFKTMLADEPVVVAPETPARKPGAHKATRFAPRTV